MRPRDKAIRRRYRAAARELRALEKPVTPRTISAHTGKEYDAVRTFFNRNTDFAAALGVKINTQHSEAEYLKAKEELVAEGKKPTSRAIAAKLGVDHSAVCRFFKQHSGAPKDAPASPPAASSAEPAWMKTVRQTRELTVQHYDPDILRVVINKVSVTRYIQLWDSKQLLFQTKREPKPDYLPTRAEIATFL